MDVLAMFEYLLTFAAAMVVAFASIAACAWLIGKILAWGRRHVAAHAQKDASSGAYTYTCTSPTPTTTKDSAVPVRVFWAPALTDADRKRFWEKVVKMPGDNACWIWCGAASKRRRGGRRPCAGGITVGDVHTTAPRFAYLVQHGPLRQGEEVVRICGNSYCVRGSHLNAVPTHVARALGGRRRAAKQEAGK